MSLTGPITFELKLSDLTGSSIRKTRRQDDVEVKSSKYGSYNDHTRQTLKTAHNERISAEERPLQTGHIVVSCWKKFKKF